MNYKGKFMAHRYEQVELFSRAEYKRRLDGVRRVMKEQEVDVALFLECGEEMYDLWLTGQRYLDLIIVPAQDEAVAVAMGELDESLCGVTGSNVTGGATGMAGAVAGGGAAGTAYISARGDTTDSFADDFATDYGRYILQKRPDPACDGVRFIGHAPDRYLASIITTGSPRRIGLVLPVNMNAGLYDEIVKAAPGVEFVDISIPLAQFRAVKSDEEWYAIRQDRNMEIKVLEALPQILRLGRTIGEMQDEVARLFIELGATGVRNGNIHYNGPMDEPANGFFDPASVHHKLQIGDRISALFELPGPGHQCIAFERHYSIGEPSKGYVDAVNNAIDVHNYAVSLMKPDSLSLAQIAVKTRKYANRLGLELYEHLGWNWMHGLGAFFYDQYSLEDYTEDLPLQEGLLLHCHPLIFRYFPEFGPDAKEGIHLVNSYRIGPDGAEDLIGIPKDLIVLYA